jgi:charged multivesicular body protein 7
MSSSIPEYISTLPEYKTSSQRLQSLYSDLARQRLSNPAGYTANVEWWRRTLSEVTARGLQSAGVVVLRADSLLVDAFRWEKVGRPLGVGYALVSLESPYNQGKSRP